MAGQESSEETKLTVDAAPTDEETTAVVQISDLTQLPMYWRGRVADRKQDGNVTELRLQFLQLSPEVGTITGLGIMSSVPFYISGSFDPGIKPFEGRRFVWAEFAICIVCQFPQEQQYVIRVDAARFRIEGDHYQSKTPSILFEACDEKNGAIMEQTILERFQSPAVAPLLPPGFSALPYAAEQWAPEYAVYEEPGMFTGSFEEMTLEAPGIVEYSLPEPALVLPPPQVVSQLSSGSGQRPKWRKKTQQAQVTADTQAPNNQEWHSLLEKSSFRRAYEEQVMMTTLPAAIALPIEDRPEATKGLTEAQIAKVDYPYLDPSQLPVRQKNKALDRKARGAKPSAVRRDRPHPRHVRSSSLSIIPHIVPSQAGKENVRPPKPKYPSAKQSSTKSAPSSPALESFSNAGLGTSVRVSAGPPREKRGGRSRGVFSVPISADMAPLLQR